MMETCLSRNKHWREILYLLWSSLISHFCCGDDFWCFIWPFALPQKYSWGAAEFRTEESKKAACYVCFPGSSAHKTASLSGEVGGSSIPLDVWEMACVFIWPWFHLTYGPPGFNDKSGHRRFRPLTTMFIPVSQPVGIGKPFTPVYTRTFKSDNRFLVYKCLFSSGTRYS